MALKHDVKAFLELLVVHNFLRAEWLGGGINELLVETADVQRRLVITWALFWPVIVLYNLGIMLLAAVLPPFMPWYSKRYPTSSIRCRCARVGASAVLRRTAHPLRSTRFWIVREHTNSLHLAARR